MGQVIATASCGTGTTTFVANAIPPERLDDAPKWQVSGLTGGITGAKITTYEYDSQGNQIATVRPDGTRTENYYNTLGQLVLVTENAWSEMPGEVSQTAYLYDGSRLVKVAALSDPAALIEDPDPAIWSLSNGSWQITEFAYGAPVLFADADGLGAPANHTAVGNNSSTLPINPSLISAIHFPNPVTGQPSEDPDLSFAYYPDGLLATRTDALGTSFRHAYDELSNRTRSAITLGSTNLPHNYASSEDFIRAIDYKYDRATGELVWAEATTVNGASTPVVAAHRFEYDQRGNLRREYQVHGATIPVPTPVTAPSQALPALITGTPVVEYTWAYASAYAGGDNHNRLLTMVFPPRPAANGIIPASNPARRTLSFGHGLPGLNDPVSSRVNHAASRIDQVGDAVLGSRLAEFGYSGTARRVVFNRGWIAGAVGAFAVSQTFNASASNGYDRLDGFGRVAELRFEGPSTGSGPVLQHSYGYAYDLVDNPIQRLVRQRPYDNQSHDNQRSSIFTYDGLQRLIAADMGELSNFSNPATGSIGPSTLLPSPRTEDWSLDPLGNHNSLSVTVPVSGGTQTTVIAHSTDERNELTAVSTTVNGGTPDTAPCIYDANGCMISDGQFFYEYDAWGRLAKVSHLNTAVFSPTGALVSGSTGAWIIHYTYDALGRLARLQRPLNGYPGYNHVEHYYYDGARRVQEVHRGIDASSANEESSEEETTTPVVTTWTDREYIHTAGPSSYIDEYVCEVTNLATTQGPMYSLQEGNYTVVGLVGSTGAVLRQHTFDAYGQLLFAEDLSITESSRVGHQGLFFHRIDAPEGTPELVPSITAPGAPPAIRAGHYHNRNRSYCHNIQMFGQADVFGTGHLASWSVSYSGVSARSSLLDITPQDVFVNGANRLAAYEANPLPRTDADGLFFGLVGLFAPTSTLDIYMDHNESAITSGKTMADVILGMVSDYAAVQDVDADWAEDWTETDDWLSMSTTGAPAELAPRIGGKGRFVTARARNGNTPSILRGMGMHEAFYKRFPESAGWVTNRCIGSTKWRPDAINPILGIIVELKPNNRRAIRLGQRQLKEYLAAAQIEWPNVKWKVMVEVYD